MKTRILVMLALVAVAPSAVLAFTSQQGESVSVSAPIADDLYVAGSRVSVQSAIAGDLIMAGADVSSAGSVSGTILAAGANLDIGGRAGNDIRAAGGNIRIHSIITGDLVTAGGNIDIQRNTTISRDLVVMAGNVYLDGNVTGKTQITAGKVYLSGVIGGDAIIKAQEIIVSSGAQIRGNLVYESQKANPALEGIVTGEKRFVQSKGTKDMRGDVFKFTFGYFIAKLLFLTIFGYLLLVFMEKYIHETSDILRRSPWQSLFTGISFFILLPILAFLLILTLIGIPVGALMIAILIFAFVFYELIGTTIWSAWVIDGYMRGGAEIWWKKLLVILGFAFLFAIISGVDIIPAWMAIGALLTRHWILMQNIRK